MVENGPRSLFAHPLSLVTETSIDWLWQGMIPKAAITVLQGSPKLGKSHILSDLAARVSTGDAMPGEVKGAGKPASVLYVQSEDSEEAVLCPRVRESGGDLRLVHTVPWVYTANGSLSSFQVPADVATLEEYARTMEPAVGLIIIDPVMNYLVGVDTYVEAEVRTALMPLLMLATNLGCAVVLCRHLTKAARGKADLDHGMGSQGFGALARATLGVEKSSGDWRKLRGVGGNYAKEPPVLYFRIKDHPEQPCAVAYADYTRQFDNPDDTEEMTEDESQMVQFLLSEVHGEDDMISRTFRPVEWSAHVFEDQEVEGAPISNIEEVEDDPIARKFLLDLIEPRALVASASVIKAGRAAGFSEDMLQRAKGDLFESVRQDNKWYWKRAGPLYLAIDAQPSHVGR